jgi:hypothetical protein
MEVAMGYNRVNDLGVKIHCWMVNLGRSNEGEEARDAR